ncbi:hypothetical protein M8J76_005802 [Diaphorina citri]|nr:hypothetical protein M8J76_005802 [Diaphorina citri]
MEKQPRGSQHRNGTALFKTVSLFVSRGRRISDRREASDPKQKKKKAGGGASMDGEGRVAVSSMATALANSNKANVKMIESLRKQSHFNRQEVETLCKIFKKLLNSSSNAGVPISTSTPVVVQVSGLPPSNGLDRVVFRELLHNTFDLVTEEILMERIFCAFDRLCDGVIHLDEWVLGLSCFLRGTNEELIKFTFLIYDLNNDGFITREEMFQLLRNSLISHPQDEDPDEGVRDLVELALRKMDYDKDGKISFQDFQQSVTDEPLLLEAFGQCLPSDAARQSFLSTLQAC